ncbi:MAG: efflux RND transporter periplasmic adaptor subunit [Lysobacterales bacterium]
MSPQLQTRKTSQLLLTGVAAGVLIGAFSMWMWSGSAPETGTPVDAARKPLYWVAPMDANYRRDQPGLSPMGMELIPVYADEGAQDSPGSVKISPEVVNNLGVRTVAVERGRISSAIDTVGYVQYDEDRRTEISPRVEGWVEKLYVKAAGNEITRGAPLYEIYAPLLVNAQEEFLLALKRNNATLIDAAADRLRALQVPAAQIAHLRKGGRANRTITVAAPQSGVIDRLEVREGVYVKPGMSLMSVNMLEHVWVIGEVYERQVNLVRKGDAVLMQLDYLPGREWKGEVAYVYPSLNMNTRTAQVRVHFENPDGYLKPGMLAQMRIHGEPGPEALLMPREALIRTGKQTRAVLVMGEGAYKSVEVKLGRIGDTQVEVLNGLKAGDQIVSSAQFLIDSESSKTSDFKRMGQPDDAAVSEARSAWVQARVVALMSGHRKVTLAHQAIVDWHWPAMTMDFSVDDGVDFERLSTGMVLHVQISKLGDKDYRLSAVHFPEANAPANVGAEEVSHSGAINHRDRSHGEVDREGDDADEAPTMDHSQHGGDSGDSK